MDVLWRIVFLIIHSFTREYDLHLKETSLQSNVTWSEIRNKLNKHNLLKTFAMLFLKQT